jgi:putative transcriptional regulator
MGVADHAGRLLVATPLIGDPHFERSVVLLLSHGDEGAFGLILNRPSDTAVDEVVDGWDGHLSPPDRLFIGGPVGTDAVIGIGRRAENPAGDLEGFSPLVDGLGSVDLGRPPRGDAVPYERLRLFAGSSGWAPGQLEDEMREGAWWLVTARPEDALTDDPEGLWRRVVRRQPGTTGWFANCPLNPSAN